MVSSLSHISIIPFFSAIFPYPQAFFLCRHHWWVAGYLPAIIWLHVDGPVFHFFHSAKKCCSAEFFLQLFLSGRLFDTWRWCRRNRLNCELFPRSNLPVSTRSSAVLSSLFFVLPHQASPLCYSNRVLPGNCLQWRPRVDSNPTGKVPSPWISTSSGLVTTRKRENILFLGQTGQGVRTKG